eukprot:TRINITY_DN5694_c0_g2_i1.p1 TRINITY_DN5694_c0_g2~~TRINITY_DN5694_c0_g2_i1.p1  ORF type:complete len:328 (+),score=62.21 TRINITY_DN5694_c0_g2_i1:40-1023(+)
MRRCLALRCPASAGWIKSPFRQVDYPELADVGMWRRTTNQAPQPVLMLTGEGGLELLSGVAENMTSPVAGIELPKLDASAEWMAKQSDLVVKYINILYSPWVHVVSHSTGSLLALYVAHKYPARIGSITIIDTPVVHENDERIFDLRRALDISKEDCNITDEDIKTYSTEIESLECDVSPPSEIDAETFSKLRSGEVVGDERIDWWLPYGSIRQVKHPMLLVQPEKAAFTSKQQIFASKAAFNVKTVQTIEDGEGVGMFDDEAFDIAHSIDTFHQRYSTQHIIESKWEEVKEFKLKGAAKMGMGGQEKEKGKGKEPKQKKKKGKKGG